MNSVIKVLELSITLNQLKSKSFHREINERMRQGINIVTLDLKNVSFMDSSGLGALVQIHKLIQSRGGKLCLSSISEQVKILLELTSMDRVFEVIEDCKEYANDPADKLVEAY